VTAPAGWDIKLLNDKKEQFNFQRAVIVKKNYQVNPIIKELQGEFTIPTVTIFAESSLLPIDGYAKFILDQLYQVTSKNVILLNTELLSETDFLDSMTVDINGDKFKRIQFKHRYKRILDTSGREINWQRDGGAKLIQDFNIIDLAIYKKNDLIIILYAVCEREFYQLEKEAFQNIITSLKFVEPAAQSGKID